MKKRDKFLESVMNYIDDQIDVGKKELFPLRDMVLLYVEGQALIPEDFFLKLFKSTCLAYDLFKLVKMIEHYKEVRCD